MTKHLLSNGIRVIGVGSVVCLLFYYSLVYGYR